jgi:hypothetical protein
VIRVAILIAALGAPAETVESAAKTAFELAEAGKLDEARQLLDDAHARTGAPPLLFVRGTLEQSAGDCDAAVDFYRRYLATDPAETDAQAARDGIKQCGGQAVPAPPPPSSMLAPTPAFAPPTTTDAPPPAKRNDRIAIGLLGSGAAATVAGGTLLGVGLGVASMADRSRTEADFGNRLDRGRALTIAGGVVLPIGTALLIAGAVRLAKHRNQRREAF